MDRGVIVNWLKVLLLNRPEKLWKDVTFTFVWVTGNNFLTFSKKLASNGLSHLILVNGYPVTHYISC
jgi:hypothetical protein